MQMGNPLQSPRRLPALLRTADSRSPRAPGFMSTTLSPRSSVQSMSPRAEMQQSTQSLSPRESALSMSPRAQANLRPTAAMREARLARLQALNEEAMAKMEVSHPEVASKPHLLARAARAMPVAPKPEAPSPRETRLHAALDRYPQERLPSPRAGRPVKNFRRSGAASPRGGDESSMLESGAPAGGAPGQEVAERAPRKPANRTVSLIQDKLAQQFTDIKKAFKYVDLDGNGRVTKGEIERAMHMWNIPIDPDHIAELMGSCDVDGDGSVDYDEFVDALARDTVAPDAMGKRGLQSKDAMGIDGQEMLNEQLGHKKHKNHAMPEWMKNGAKGGSGAPEMTREEVQALMSQDGKKEELGAIKNQAMQAVNSRFGNMRKAFQYLDLDGSGKVGRNEVERALHMWGVPYDPEKLDMLMVEMDSDGDGSVSYNEFIDHLARDTVAPAAMGKRDMQSKEAMGVDAQEMLNEQLGHKKHKNYKMASFVEEDDKKGKKGKKKTLADYDKKEVDGFKDLASTAVNSRFSNMRKAFQYLDQDGNGKVGRGEVQRALHMWGVPFDEEKLDALMLQLDSDGDGTVSYDEFIDHLARDTVAPAAMGKRDMQSLEAMGVDGQEMLNEQLGHKKHKNYKMPSY